DRAAQCVQRTLPHGLGDGGVGMDGGCQLIQRQLAADGKRPFADQIRGAGPNDVHTQHLAVFPPGDDLHQALAPVQDQSLAVGAHGELAHHVVDPLRLGLLLCETHRGSLRLDVHAGGIGGFVVVGLHAADILRSHLAHGAGGVGQLGIALDTVADGVHAGHAGLHLVVDDDPAPVVGKAGSL
ncbi:AAA family ATPase, partial [Dysosmobacter welbionis]